MDETVSNTLQPDFNRLVKVGFDDQWITVNAGVLLLREIGLVFRANIGTCVTAILSSFGPPREAVQAAWLHVLFNVSSVLLWMFFIPQFADIVRTVSPSANVNAIRISQA